MTSGGGNAHTGGKGGIAKFKVAIKNSGKLAVQVGDLDCAGSFNNMNTSAGIISIASGAELDFDQGGTSVAKAFTMVKGSYLTFNGGTFVLSSVPTAGAKRQTGIARTEISPDAVMFGGRGGRHRRHARAQQQRCRDRRRVFPDGRLDLGWDGHPDRRRRRHVYRRGIDGGGDRQRA